MEFNDSRKVVSPNSLPQGNEQGIFPVIKIPDSETRMNKGDLHSTRELAGKMQGISRKRELRTGLPSSN